MIERLLLVIAVIAFIVIGHKIEQYIEAEPARKYEVEAWCTLIMLGMGALIFGVMVVCWVVGVI